MHRSKFELLVAASAALALCACDQKRTAHEANEEKPANTAATDHKDPVQSATAAAPEALSRNATVVQAQADGSMKTLREGSNGWTCMPDNPATPGPDPMCLDANGLRWAQAWMSRQQPPAGVVGLAYMLTGGTDASNTDPYAQSPSEGNNWIETGPHLMVLGSREILQGHPADPKPDTSVPFVMWAGTPYAHLMIPIGAGGEH